VLAKRLNVSRPVVTRAENAAHPVPSDAVLAAWAGATGAGLDTLTDLAQRAKSGTPDWFMPYRHAESGARILRYWSPIVVPGVAQTSGYMRALFEDEGPLLDQVDELAAARLQRQSVIGRVPITMIKGSGGFRTDTRRGAPRVPTRYPSYDPAEGQWKTQI
jgi:transcriptional regulator with XRE-family HTH domain